MTNYVAMRTIKIQDIAKRQGIELTTPQAKVLGTFDKRTEGSQCGDGRQIKAYERLESLGLTTRVPRERWTWRLTEAGKAIRFA